MTFLAPIMNMPQVEETSPSVSLPSVSRRSSKKTRKQEWACDVPGCNAILYSKSSRFRHKKLHEQPSNQYQCDECSASFLVKLDLTDHKRKAHMQKGTYVICDQCDRTFSSLSNLNAHKEIHQAQGVPQFKCNICSTAYFHRSALYRHQRNDHDMRRPTDSRTSSIASDSDTSMCSEPYPTPHPSPIPSAVLSCPFCDLKMGDKSAFYLHLESKHFLTWDHRCLLNACNEQCHTLEELQQHRAMKHSLFNKS
jgi:uncharacterized protein YlaI